MGTKSQPSPWRCHCWTRSSLPKRSQSPVLVQGQHSGAGLSTTSPEPALGKGQTKAASSNANSSLGFSMFCICRSRFWNKRCPKVQGLKKKKQPTLQTLHQLHGASPTPGAPPSAQQLTGPVLSVNKQEGIEQVSKEILSLPVGWKTFLPTECNSDKNVGRAPPAQQNAAPRTAPGCTTSLLQPAAPGSTSRAKGNQGSAAAFPSSTELQSLTTSINFLTAPCSAHGAQQRTPGFRLCSASPFCHGQRRSSHTSTCCCSTTSHPGKLWDADPSPFQSYGAVHMLNWSKCNLPPSLLHSLGMYFDFAGPKADVAN